MRLDLFLDMIAAERGAAKNTLEAYRRDLENYLLHLKHAGQTDLSSSTDDIRHYLQALEAEGLKATTSARHLSSIRQFHKFLYTEGHRTDDPALIIEGPRQGLRLPKTLSMSEVDRLLSTSREGLGDEARPLGERMRSARMAALLELLYATGLRVSELVALPRTTAKARTPLINVKGKGGRERMVPLPEGARNLVNQYLDLLNAQNPKAPDSPWLFPADSDSGHLTRQAFARDLKDMAIRAGLVPSRVSPHVLRHAFASHLLQNGADLRVVQELLGHADVSTTQIYTHVLDERMKAMVRDLHPLGDED